MSADDMAGEREKLKLQHWAKVHVEQLPLACAS